MLFNKLSLTAAIAAAFSLAACGGAAKDEKKPMAVQRLLAQT